MGQAPSQPRPGAKFQVVGAGLPRTGTASLTKALEILLQGPVYHGGTQITLADEREAKSWIKALRHTPIGNDVDQQIIMSTLQQRFRGFVACTDVPGSLFVRELLELHPDIRVICTIRDKDDFVASLIKTSEQARMKLLAWILWPLPTLRYFPQYLDAVQGGRWTELYYHDGVKRHDWAGVWDNHMAYLQQTVPERQLLFFDVREGWGPLCKFLGCNVPKDIAFPKINDGKAMEAFAAKHVREGLIAWAWIIGGIACGAGTVFWLLKLK